MSDNDVILKLFADQTAKLAHAEVQLDEAKKIIEELIRKLAVSVKGMQRGVRFLKILKELDNE